MNYMALNLPLPAMHGLDRVWGIEGETEGGVAAGKEPPGEREAWGGSGCV